MIPYRLILILFFASLALCAQQETVSQDIQINPLIQGTLLKPNGATKLAIIVAGSGPTDRNGNQQMMRNNSLKLLAEELATQNIASFRYDKRVLTLLKRNALQEEKLRFENFIEDLENVLDFFSKSEYTAIYIIGHSQGSLVGMVAAQKKPVSGFISLAGSGQSIDRTILSQIKLQMPGLEASAAEALATLKEKGKVKDFNPALASILRPQVQPFMASWMQYNPRREIRKLKIPTLIINGTKDLQVDTKEADLLKKAKPDAQFKLIEGMNHVLRKIEGDDLENSKSYNETGRPIMPEVTKIIGQFITEN